MKFKRLISLIKAPKVLISLIAGMLAVAGVIIGIVLASSSDEPEKLATPEVAINDNVAAWQTNINAEKWEISIGGVLSYLEADITTRVLSPGESFKIRAIGDGKEFSNSDWSNTVTYSEPPVQTYTVIWKNYDGAVLSVNSSVKQGDVPFYTGQTPTKPSDEMYNYIHSGWSPELTSISADTVYTAVFSPSARLYTVNWVSEGIVVKTDKLTYGSTPVYTGAAPTKQADAQYCYTFDSWTPAVTSVVSDVTYTASFSRNLNTYNVEFYAEDGVTLLNTVTVAYGATAMFTKPIPEKPETVSHKYEFSGWVSAPGSNDAATLTNISGNIKVYASFEQIVKKVIVTVRSSNTEYGAVSVQTIPNIPYGSEISVSGNSVTVGGVTVVATATNPNAEFTYNFVDWSSDTDTVTHNTVITAVFERTKNTYSVIWKNIDGSILKTDNVEYGITPTYNGITPKHPTEPDGLYLFNGWTPAVATVTEPAVYVARYVRNENVKVVTFYDEDGVTVLGVCVVQIGDDAVYPNAAPTKNPTSSETYIFDKWLSEKNGSTEASLTAISDNMSVYASYSASLRMYEVVFRNWDGSSICVDSVGYATSAVAPTPSPEREGYRFVGWDKDFSEITADTVINAEFVQCFAVSFVDYDDAVLKAEAVDIGMSATAPADPTRPGYRFVGWSGSFDAVYSDTVVVAQYEKLYTVTFIDYDGTVLLSQSLTAGSVINEPESLPHRTGYTFSGWSEYDTYISADTEIFAEYAINYYTVSFKLPDGKVISTQSIRYQYSAKEPAVDDLFVSWDGSTPSVYGFSGWDAQFDTITTDAEIIAIYAEVIDKPIVLIQNVKSNSALAQATVGIYLVGSCDSLCGFNITLKYDRALSVSGNDLSFNGAVLNMDKSKTEVVHSGNKNEIVISWVNGEGIPINTAKLFTVTFGTAFADIGIYKISVEGDANIISGDLEKIIPIIITGSVTVE